MPRQAAIERIVQPELRAKQSTSLHCLLLAHYFAPSQKIGARRIDAVAGRMSARGWNTTVCAPSVVQSLPTDSTITVPDVNALNRIAASVPPVWILRGVLGPLRWARAIHGSLEASNRSLARKSIEFGLRMYLHAIYATGVYDEFVSWSRHARRTALSLAQSTDFDVIYASVPPITPALTAAKLARETGAHLMLDYRDPWIDPVFQQFLAAISPESFAHLRGTEDHCLSTSRIVVTVSPTIAQSLSQRTSAEIYVAPHGIVHCPDADSSNLIHAKLPTPESFLLYAGSLYYGRRLVSILQAVKILSEEAGRRFVVVYCGPSGKEAVEDACAANAEEYLISLGRVPHHQVLELSRAAIANVLVIAPCYEYTYPGKLWEQIAAGRPIVCVSPQDAISAQLITSRGLGVAHEGDDVTKLASSLKQIIFDQKEIAKDAHKGLMRNRILDDLLERIEDLLVSAQSETSDVSIKTKC